MTTKELLQNIASATGMEKSDLAFLLNTTTEVMADELLSGHDILLQNFGTLEVKEKKERVCVHPQTKERTLIPAKIQISFKPSSVLKNQVNKNKA